MGKSLFRPLCLLVAALMLIPSVYAGDLARRTSNKTANRIELGRQVYAQEKGKTAKRMPQRNAASMASSQFAKVRSGNMRPPQARSTMPNRSSSGSLINMIGTLSYSANTAAQLGVYDIYSNGDVSYLNNVCTGGYGAVLDGDIYRVCFAYDFIMFAYYSVSSYDINNNWAETSVDLDDATMIAMCMDKDPISGQIYGCFFNAEGTSYEFGAADFDTMTRTTICELAEAWSAIGFDGDGQLYAIDEKGVLVKVDKSTGDTTTIGSTGYLPYYVGGGAVDTQNHVMYWFVYPENEDGGYFVTVDLATAKTTVIKEFDDTFTGLVIPSQPNDGAPAMAKNFSVSFPKGSLSGTASFDVPTVNYAGQACTGELDYEVFANGESVATGSTVYGGHVQVPLEVAKSGNYKFSVVLSNEIGLSQEAKVSTFVGNDTPIAPSVTISYKDGSFYVSWSPVKESLNGGYMDLSKMTYKVTRYPDGVVVASSATGTSLSDPVEYPSNLVTYYYTVQASCNGIVSDPGTSNTVTLGEIVPPYLETFDTQAAATAYAVVDANEDGKTWSWDSADNGMSATYNSKNSMDDWLITPSIRLEAGKVYYITVDARCADTKYPERMELKVGTSTEVSDMTYTLLPATDVTSTSFNTFGDYFIPTADGTYNLGIHGISDTNMWHLYVKNVSISEGVVSTAPGAVTDASVTPGANGVKTADITFTTPTLNFVGDPLTSLTKVTISRGNQVVKTFDNPEMGKSYTFQDTLTADGDYTYTITPYNESGAGRVFSLSTYVGLGYPAAVTGIEIVENEDGNVTVTWDPVTTDENGTPLDASQVTYVVRDLTSSNYDVIERGITNTEYNFDAVDEGKQAFVYVGVSAVTSRGEGLVSYSDMIACGTPYSLPYVESFPNGSMSYIIGMRSNIYSIASWSLFNDSGTVTAYDDDNGFLGFGASYLNAKALIFTGKISLAGTTSPEFSFAIYNHVSNYDPTLRDPNLVQIECKTLDGDWVEVCNKSVYELTGVEDPVTGWYKAHVSLAQFAGKVVQLRITCTAVYYGETLFDALTIKEAGDHNLVAGNVAVPSVVKPNEEFDVKVDVANDGLSDILGDDYTAELYLNGDLVATIPGEDVIGYETATLTFKQTVNVANPVNSAYKVVVNYPDDIYPADNTSKEAKFKIEQNDLNAPKDLAATIDDNNNVTVTWSTPDPVVIASTYTESFENATAGDATYGDWTFVDADKQVVGGTDGVDIPGIPAGEGTASFVVFNGVECGIGSCAAHTGDNCLISMYAYDLNHYVDDWAISPEMTGDAQTISLWARSYQSSYPESFQILYSTTNTDISSFTLIDTFDNVPKTWTEYKSHIPAGAKYFAIRNYSFANYFLLIDDVSYQAADANAQKVYPIGYNVYRNGVKINDELVTGTSFVDSDNIGIGVYKYYVSAVYADGESMGAGPVKIDTTSVGRVSSKANVVAENRTIIIRDAADARVEVLSLDGKIIYIGKGDAKVPVNNGVYLVKVGKALTKLMVK
jgi:hypothetical protein